MKLRKKKQHVAVRTTYDLAELVSAAPKSGAKILHLDVESSLMKVYAWGVNKQFISHEDIIQDWNLLSFSAKWHGTGPCLYQSIRTQRNPVNDFKLCKSLHKLLSLADVVVAHNGKRFDLRKIRARMAHNRMPPIPDTRIIDTLLEARKVFGFSSQRLAYLTTHFGDDGMRKNSHGKFPGKQLWYACQSGNQEAWDEMESYNIPDVLSMESMYEELRPWFQGAQNLGVFATPHVGHTCPNCGSEDVRRKGERHTQVSVYPRYRCNSCGGWSRGREQLLSREERMHVKVN